MITGGAVPFRNFKEKLREMSKLRHEYDNKVKIWTEGNLILYTHMSKCKDGKIVS